MGVCLLLTGLAAPAQVYDWQCRISVPRVGESFVPVANAAACKVLVEAANKIGVHATPLKCVSFGPAAYTHCFINYSALGDPPGTAGSAFYFIFDSYIVRLSQADGSLIDGTILDKIEPGKEATLVANVYDQNEQIVPNVNVRLEVDVVENSGGHHHHANRPKGDLGGASPNQHIITGNTGAGGLAFTFTAPAPAGDHQITATCTDRTCTPEGPDTVWVGTKGLIPLPATSVYVLIPNADTAHPNNHYMTSLAAFRLTALASLYHGTFPDDPLLHLNDASLERGGLFDYKARFGQPWVPPHNTHREGDIVDIRANPKIKPETAIPEENFADFIDLAERVGGAAGIHSPGTSNQHFHLKF